MEKKAKSTRSGRSSRSGSQRSSRSGSTANSPKTKGLREDVLAARLERVASESKDVREQLAEIATKLEKAQSSPLAVRRRKKTGTNTGEAERYAAIQGELEEKASALESELARLKKGEIKHVKEDPVRAKELQAKMADLESQLGVVQAQTDSVLLHLGKKFQKGEKERMRELMASMTGEAMKLDLEMRSVQRQLDACTIETEESKESKKKSRHKKVEGLVEVSRKSKDGKKSKSKDGKLQVNMMDTKNKDKEKKAAPSSMGTVLMQRDVAGGLSPAMQAEIDRLRDAIKETPNDPTLHHTLGFSLVRVAGDTEGGIAAFLDALKIKPDMVAARVDLGLAYYKQEKFAAAMDEYKKALETDPDHANALVNLANAQRQCGETRESIAHYLRVLELQPNHATAALNLGNAYQTLGEHDKANAMYEKVLEISPTNTYARTKLAEQALSADDNVRARELATKVLERDAKNVRALVVLGAVNEREGQHKDALKFYKQAHEHDATNTTVLSAMAAVCIDTNKLADAATYLEKASKIDATDHQVLSQLGALHVKRGDAATAIPLFESAVKHGRAALEAAQKLSGADANAPQLVAVKSQLASIYNNYGHALDETDNFELAVAQYQASLELERTVSTLNKLGTSLVSQKKAPEAIEYFMEALSITPTDATVNYNLAAAHAALGDVAEALRHAQLAELHGDNFEAAIQMVSVLKKHLAQ